MENARNAESVKKKINKIIIDKRDSMGKISINNHTGNNTVFNTVSTIGLSLNNKTKITKNIVKL